MTLSSRPRNAAIARCILAATVLWLAAGTARAQAASGNDVLDLAEAAALLRVKTEAIRSLAESQRIPARRVGDEWRFWRAALLEWLKGDAPQPLDRELSQITGRGLTPPQAQTTATPPTVGERPATPTTEEVALRDQRVLLGRGAATIDFGASYGRSEHSIFPVVRAEDKAVGMNATLRYGLVDDLQLTMRVPTTWRRTTTYSDATISGSSSPRVTNTPEGMAGDASISLLGVAAREAVGRPTILWSIDGVVPTGGGDRGIGGGLVVSKSYDPAVLFAGVTYLYGLRTNPSDARWSLAKHNYGIQAGYTYAVNDTLALSTAFLGTYRNSRSADGISIPSSRENYALSLGTTWLLARGLFMEPSVAMGIGGDNPGLTLSINFSHSFRWRGKH